MSKRDKLKVYYYAKCGTCRDALKKLRALGYEDGRLELQDLFEQPSAEADVRGWLSASGLPLKKFFNVSGEVYKEMNLKDRLAGMSEEEQIALLASNGRLVKRPIVTDGSRITVGYKADEYDRVWGGK